MTAPRAGRARSRREGGARRERSAHPLVAIFALVFAFGLAACAPPPHAPVAEEPRGGGEVGAPDAAAESLDDWPKQAVVGAGRGPGLYLGPEVDAPAIGYLSEGVSVEIAGLPERGRVPVRVRSGMRVRGYFPVQRLEAYALRRGRIRDTPVYVGPSDAVRVLGAAGGGRTLVSAKPALVSSEGVTVAVSTYEGSFPAIGLGADVLANAEPVPGAPVVVRGDAPVQVYESPGGGRVLVTLPAGASFPGFEVSREGAMSAVLLGRGPYLAGYVAAQPVAAAPVAARSPRSFATRETPQRIAQDDTGSPLARVAEGTRVVFDGVTIASVDQLGWARVLERHEDTGEADVFVAVDDAVAVRGMVPLEALGPVAAP